MSAWQSTVLAEVFCTLLNSEMATCHMTLHGVTSQDGSLFSAGQRIWKPQDREILILRSS